MKCLPPLLELVEVLVPDFLTLGLLTPVVFGVYCILKTLDLARAVNPDLALGSSLAVAYLLTVALNIATPLLAPARTRLMAVGQSKPRTKRPRSESAQGAWKGEPVERGGAPVES